MQSQSVLKGTAAFYYDPVQRPAVAPRPRLGVPLYRLEFGDGYISGVVTGARLDRFLSYGVNLDQFRQGTWYRTPPTLAAGLRRLTAGLTPLRLTAAALCPNQMFAAAMPCPGPAPTHQPPGRLSGMPWMVGLLALAGAVALTAVGIRLVPARAKRSPRLSAR